MTDTCELLDDGTVRFTLATEPYALRVPTVGEIIDFEARLKEAIESAAGGGDAAAVGHVADWVEHVAGILADRPLPPRDDWPVWMASPNLPAQMKRHWLTVPLRRGPTETETG
ncbi:hypothetical protein [Nitrosomonas sp.]|uniref:hypothetical protein n=1 Tax=Nitrosomonas sp. TaxID=42353 RepID=UPI0025E5BCEC|nr:hypothetical protein [Nitrosomonas sp.]MBV6448518.1 hypothetical protein [Nitrosomonas sp.]